MRRVPKKATAQDQLNSRFLATVYSNAELDFLIEHLGEAPEVAMPEGEDLPAGVNPAAVTGILDRTYRLELLQSAARERSGDPDLKLWCGFDVLREVCQQTRDWNDTVKELKARVAGSTGPVMRAAGAPSLCMWDPDTDIPYPGGVGADGDIVQTALDGGQRIPLFVMLRETGLGAIKELGGVAGFLKGKKARGVRKAQDDERKSLLDITPNALDYEHGPSTSVVKCPICGHTEVFETSKPTTKRKAEQLMLKHLSGARVKPDQHHILAQRLKSGKAGTGSGAKKKDAPEPEDTDDTEPATED